MVKYPIGIQSFEKIRKDGYVYVDKTRQIHELVTYGTYYFLSRPRRFGKSLLLSTLKAFFEGKRELFKGLYIDSCEDLSWASHPVIYIDLNAQNYTASESSLLARIDAQLSTYELEFECPSQSEDLAIRFMSIIKGIYEKTGKRVVVLIDEYDKPILDTLENDELCENHRNILRGFYSVLKSADEYLKFCLLTGITKYSNLNIFSGLNNLNNISLDDSFEAICGITEKELTDNFSEGIEALAVKEGVSFDEAVKLLKDNYDGYHFSQKMTDIYNPFSVINALYHNNIGSYWFATGTPTSLIRQLKKLDINVSKLNGMKAKQMVIEDMGGDNPYTILYQAGYLTIKGYDRKTRRYVLGYPNREVEESFLECLLPVYANTDVSRSGSCLLEMSDHLNNGEPAPFLENFNSLFASFPYETALETERHFHNIFYTVMTLLGYDVNIEHHTSNGSIDLVAKTEDYIYLFEFKIDKKPEVALRQIEEKGYALAFASDSRKLFKIGVEFSTRKRRISDWEIVE